jgi:uncharacterized protein YcbX
VNVSRIRIFPIKSLDGVELRECGVTAGGILENDRIYAVMDADGKYMNGKRTPRVHQLRCAFDAAFREVRLWEGAESTATQFTLADRAPISRWLSEFFALPVTLEYDPVNGFPDDKTAFGPTIVSEASLEAIRSWYPDLPLESVRRRFRANLELVGGPAFCEDELFGAPEQLKPFQVGNVRFLGHNPCQRCVVPTRDPDGAGPAVHEFQRRFADLRKQHLPPWADARRFNHFYRFAINTSIPPSEAGKRLRVGDAVIA